MTFSYKGRSLLFCKSIIGCPLSTANFFSIQHFSIDNFTFASIYICSPGSIVLEKSLAFIWRQEWDKLMPNPCSQTYFKPLKKLCIMHKCFPPPANDTVHCLIFFSLFCIQILRVRMSNMLQRRVKRSSVCGLEEKWSSGLWKNHWTLLFALMCKAWQFFSPLHKLRIFLSPLSSVFLHIQKNETHMVLQKIVQP